MIENHTTKAQKQQAIDLHSQQASQFVASYEKSTEAVYDSCFTYSRKRLQACLDHYLPLVGAGLRLLDVGCGTGHQIAAFRERGFDVAGVDGSPEMLLRAREKNPGTELHQADVEHLPFSDASFDFIVCIEVLRYLPKPFPCIQEIARVLKPQGVCLVTALPILSMNGYYLVNRITGLVPVGNLVRLKQFFSLSHKLRRDFLRAGFTQADIHGVYCGPVNWVQRLAPSCLPFLLQKWEPVDSKLADWPLIREFSNMFLVHAVR